MKVALYYPWVYLRSGVERMIVELVSRSEHDWTIFTSHYYPGQTFPEFQKLKIVELSDVSVDRGYSAVSNAAITILRQKINLSDFDALVVSSEGLGDLITFRNHSVPVICYCHTPLKIIHDPFVRRKYLNENPRMKAPFFFFSRIFKIFDRIAWRYYDYVLCNSDEVRSRIIRAKLAPKEKVEVLSPGLDVEYMQPTWKYDKRFVVVGRIKWWKNIELAIEAFREFKRNHPEFSDFRLFITGQVESGSEQYLSMLKKIAGTEDDIVFQRDPTEEELMETYRSCYCLLFPSLNEDWGLTPLEAMGAGKPVIAVNQGGPKESVVDGETGYLVSPESRAFAEAMSRLAADPELTQKLGRAGAERVKRYDWSHFVQRFDARLEKIAGNMEHPE
ncbi:MAG: glycosyltransferase [Actinobacteria bacterium]|nr:glycosyltransferase [Actinomycetota bacterium]